MLLGDDRKWQGFLKSAEEASAVCFVSADEYLLATHAFRLTQHLQELWEDSEITRIAGEDFTLEEAVLAAGTISFFATKRIIRIDRLQPSSLSDKDMKEFCELLHDTENAVFIVTLLCKNKKDTTGKKFKQLEDAVKLTGCWQELSAPGGGDLKAMAKQMAKSLGASLEDAAAQELTERTGGDLYLLSNEIAKLAAGAEYGTITSATVAALATRTVEADVFKMIDAVTAGRPAEAFAVLDRLLYLRSEPVVIVGALASSFVDMARVQTGGRHRVGYAGVHKDLQYTGSDYRLKRASQTAARFSPQQLRSALEILIGLDTALKSSPLDNAVLLQTALSELCGIARSGRR
jgi:DNA polymerase-3 subunit delta